MATFVLVHGAWHGGWCWADVARRLRAAGHDVFTPTLTGCGERSHLLHPGIDADVHVTDVANVLRWEGLTNVILVGHSYGGMVITGVAGQVPERLRGLVYLDAFVPEVSSVSLFANANPARMAGFQAQIDAGAIALEPDHFHAWSDDPERLAWLRAQCTPHPVGCFQNGVTLTGHEAEVPHRGFILAVRNNPSPFWAEYERVRARPGWRVAEIDCLHDAMVEAPGALVDVLCDMEAAFA